MSESLEKLGKTYLQYPPRKLQSLGYTGPVTISSYERFEHIQKQLMQEGIKVTLFSG
jgi:hypothetical protein